MFSKLLFAARTLHAPIDMSSAVFYLFVSKVVSMILRAFQAFSVSRRWNISRERAPRKKDRDAEGNERTRGRLDYSRKQ